MWLLSCYHEGGRSYRLTKEKDHCVGRTIGDLLLTGDQSVSRKHAVFKFTTSSENGGSVRGVTVTDLVSKYGTYLNDSVKLDPSKPYILKHGDIIKFGCQWNEWRFDAKPLVVATSTVPAEVKMTLEIIISKLGGILVNEWQETCSHLTMASILLTAKVVCALASAVPIVTPEYWKCFEEALEQKKLPPDHNNFLPPLKENILNKNKVSFAVNEERKTIFSDKIFVFCTEKQMKKFKTPISAAGGKSMILTESNWNAEEFCKPHYILMQHISSDVSESTDCTRFYDNILKLFKRKGGRPIPDSEIGLAVLMCSTEIYCNPQYNVVSNILHGGSTVNLSQIKSEEVLAADTPSVLGDPSNVKIEEPLEETSLVDIGMSIPDSNPSTSHSSDSGKMNEEEICLAGSGAQGRRGSKSSSATEHDKPEPASGSSRKRTALNDPSEPAAKIISSGINSVEKLISANSSFENFNFTDLFGHKTPKPSGSKDQKGTGLFISNMSENAKRKRDDSEGVLTEDCHPKKSCTETACSTRLGIPVSSHEIASVSKLNTSSTAPEDQIVRGEIASTSKNIESHILKANYLEERTKEDEGCVRGVGSSTLLEENVLNTYSRSLSNDVRNGISKSREVIPDATPSTSRQVMSKEVPSTGKQPKIRKADRKVEERRGRHGMEGEIMDVMVEMRDLLVDRPPLEVRHSDAPQHLVNFKKFKKVASPHFKDTLHQIIGGSDLIPWKEGEFV